MNSASAPSMVLRFAAMLYESILLFAVLFAASFPLLTLTGWTYPLEVKQRWLLQSWLFLVAGLYFAYCWSRSGQTLALKTWQLQVVNEQGQLLSVKKAVLRYLLAWHLVLPGILFILLAHPTALQGAFALVLGAMPGLVLPYLIKNEKKGVLLHDRLLNTALRRTVIKQKI